MDDCCFRGFEKELSGWIRWIFAFAPIYGYKSLYLETILSLTLKFDRLLTSLSPGCKDSSLCCKGIPGPVGYTLDRLHHPSDPLR